MNDTYRAVFNAFNLNMQGFNPALIHQEFGICADGIKQELCRPSVKYQPTLMKDGDMWLAMYGDLPTGCCGSGETPEKAMEDFDKRWNLP